MQNPVKNWQTSLVGVSFSVLNAAGGLKSSVQLPESIDKLLVSDLVNSEPRIERESIIRFDAMRYVEGG